MNWQISKIEVLNPIDKNAVDDLIQKIRNVNCHDLLLIDFGNHDFESIETLKFCKSELERIEPVLLKFNKIAFLSVPPYKNESIRPEKLEYFNSEEEAKEWLTLFI